MTVESGKVPFGAVSQVDLDMIDDVPDNGLEAYFGALGETATASQLRVFLDGRLEGEGEDTGADKAELVARFVQRRVQTVRALRDARDSLDAILPKD